MVSRLLGWVAVSQCHLGCRKLCNPEGAERVSSGSYKSKSSPWLSALGFLLVHCIAFQNYILTQVKLLLDHTWHCIGKSFSFYSSQPYEIKTDLTDTRVAMCMYGSLYRKLLSKYPIWREKRLLVWVCMHLNTFMNTFVYKTVHNVFRNTNERHNYFKKLGFAPHFVFHWCSFCNWAVKNGHSTGWKKSHLL